MRGLLEVREFDKITCCEERPDGYAYMPERAFHDLVDLIHTATGDETNADALEFMRVGYRRKVGDVVSVGSYVGVIQMQSGYQVQVLPKIDFGDAEDDGNVRTKQVFLRMLCSMRDFPSKVFNESNLRVERMPLYEIFVSMYVSDVRRLVRHGIKSAYVAREDNLGFCKGKLMVREHVRRNIAHGERFFVRHDEYLADRAENRLVKATLLKLGKVSESVQNQRDIRQLLALFEQVSASTNYHRDFAHVALDRSMGDYEGLMRWSRVFLLGKSFSAFSGESGAKALLFPMEKVFESYVARQLRRIVADLGWEVSAQDRGYYLFDEPQRFALRPDIVVTRDDGSRVVMDTKWKRLEDKPQRNYGISQADMYQMYAYAKKYGTSDVWLLYPTNPEMRGYGQITFSSYDGVTVRVFLVDVANIEECLGELREELMVM